MMEKKNFVVNCDVCDTRKVNEETLEGFEKITINGDVVLTNERSRQILGRYPVTMNVDMVLDAEGDVEVQSYNGSYEIKPGSRLAKDTILTGNGSLKIAAGTQEVLERYTAIIINGSVTYPESVASYVKGLKVNGSVTCYPDDCTVLKSRFVLDPYFPLRVKENGRYFAAKKVFILDEKVDVSVLKNKNVQFVTPKAVIAESKVHDAVVCFPEETEIEVVPFGYTYIPDDLTLTENTLRQYGTKLYIGGDLYLNEESTPCIERLKGIYAEGNVELLAEQEEAFSKVTAVYQKMIFIKGRMIKNKVRVNVDQAMLDSSKDGISIKNCAAVVIDENVMLQSIRDKMQIKNCAAVSCSPEQISTVQMIAENVTNIGEEKEKLNLGDTIKNMLGSKVINADNYIL